MYRKIMLRIRSLLVGAEDVVHVVVAVFLLLATVGILLQTIEGFNLRDYHAIFNLINNALLVLIIKEILWTIIKFLGGREVTISSFIFIGVISAIRRLLLIEAGLPGNHNDAQPFGHVIELGATAMVVLILVIAFYYLRKASNVPQVPQCDFCDKEVKQRGRTE